MLASLAVLWCALASQDPDLGPLRAAFRAVPGDAPRVAIAVVPGRDPVVLARGKDARSREVDESTLVPLGAASRLLIADALRHGMRVDPGQVVFEWARGPRTVDDLLNGTLDLPDWYAWSAVEHAPDRAALLECATIAGRADRMFRLSTAGMAEIALLEPLLLDERAPDLATALRLHLAPHVPGLEPRDARALGDDDRRRVLPLRAGLPAGIAVEHAEPAALRLVLTAKEIASWWQWRLQRGGVPATGFRAGGIGEATGHPEKRCWRFVARGPVAVRAVVYGDPAEPGDAFGRPCGALVVFDQDQQAGEELQQAFELCLFGPGVPPVAVDRFGGRVVLADPFSPLRDTSWVLRAGDEELRIEVRGARTTALRFVHGDRVLRARDVYRTGLVGFDVDLGTDDAGDVHRLIVHHVTEPSPELHVVWQRTREGEFSLPRPLFLVPAK